MRILKRRSVINLVGAIALLAALGMAAISTQQAMWATHLLRDEGAALLFGNPSHAYFVGSTSLPQAVLIAEGHVSNLESPKRNGCFVLRSAEPKATVVVSAPGFEDVRVDANSGFYALEIRLAPVESQAVSQLNLTTISGWRLIRETAAYADPA